MRRRRSHLQVQLFPFLSVLLCTLGALILLLLVLDQKARRQKAEEAARLQLASAEQSAELQQRLHSLQEGREQLRRQAHDLRGRQAHLTALLQRQQVELAARQRALLEEDEQVARLEQAIRDRQTQARRLQEQQAAAATEQGELRKQMQLLEKAIQQLQQAARRQAPLYSLVPYKGRHGTHRPAIYLECADNRAFFRPDGGSLSLTDIQEGGKANAAIEQRYAKLGAGVGSGRPYVMLLIRPSGIPLYYALLRVLQGDGIDVGYEFIEEDWALDFSEPGAEKPAVASASQGKPTSRVWHPTDSSDRLGEGTDGFPRHKFPAEPPGAPAAPVGEAVTPILAAPNRPSPGVPNHPAGGVRLVPPIPTSANDRASGPKGLVLDAAKERAGETGPLRPDVQDGHAPDKTATPGTPRKAVVPAGREETGRLPRGRTPAALGPSSEEDGKSPTQPARPLPSVIAARQEWEIVIVCAANGVELPPRKVKIALQELGQKDNPLAGVVRRLIEQRKQQHPTAQPRLKFLIRVDGLRAYYLAASALEPLNLPTTCEILAEGQSPDPSSP
jgi:hypothetical protein